MKTFEFSTARMTFASRSMGPMGPSVLVLALAGLLGSPAHAADKKAAAPPAGSKTPLLSPAQLRDCVAQKEKLGKDTESVVKTKAALAAEQAEIESSAAALSEQAATLDRTSGDAVSAYNDKVIERNGRVQAYQAKVDAYNVDAEAVIAAKDAYNKACVDRRYDERDMVDLQRKKK